jgi:hypothetical protein
LGYREDAAAEVKANAQARSYREAVKFYQAKGNDGLASLLEDLSRDAPKRHNPYRCAVGCTL